MSKKVLELNAECQQCGKRFHVKPSALKHTKFCSKECHDIAQTKGEIISCATCGKELRVSPSLLRERNFCCNECRLKWLSHYVTEVVNVPGHSAGKGGVDYAKIDLDKAGLLPGPVAAQAQELRRQLKEKFKEYAIVGAEYNAPQGDPLDINPEDDEVFPPPAGETPPTPQFEEAPPLPDDDNLPFA